MVMELRSPSDAYHERTSIDLLIPELNEHAATQGYAVVKGRSKVSKLGVRMKYWINCDRGGEVKPRGHGHRLTSSRCIGCPFEAIAKLENNLEDELGLGSWIFTVKCPDHNHPPTKPSASVPHRMEALKKPEVRRELEKEWPKGSRVNSTLKGLRLDLEDPIFKPQDIWNANAVFKAATMGSLTPTQALMRYLTESPEWYVDSKKKEYNDELQFLFFTPKVMQKLLRLNMEILIIDCTYKTNKYKMPLLIITEVTAINTTFYAGFCFMRGENYTDYVWVMEALVRLYNYLDLPYPTTVISDGDKALSPALSHVFHGEGHRVNHLLCIWHINQNVTANCKKYFPTNEEWEAFYKRWKDVVYATTSEILEERYYALHHDYPDANWGIFDYLEEHLWPRRRKWAKYYTDQVLHFGNTSSSRGEGAHHQVKQELQFSTGE
jgi:hypothetical protein